MASESVVFSVRVDAGCEGMCCEVVDAVCRKLLFDVDLASSSGYAPGMLETSEPPNRASFRRLTPDLALFTPLRRGRSVLRLPLSILAFTSSAAPRMLLLLAGLLTSESSTVSGGLGGALVGADVVFAGDELLRLRSSFPTSVASGVTGVALVVPISSLLPTASRLCALLKVG